MSKGIKAAQEIKAAHKELYAKSRLNNAFGGGNVGLIYLGESIIHASELIAKSIDRLASSIEKTDSE